MLGTFCHSKEDGKCMQYFCIFPPRPSGPGPLLSVINLKDLHISVSLILILESATCFRESSSLKWDISSLHKPFRLALYQTMVFIPLQASFKGPFFSFTLLLWVYCPLIMRQLLLRRCLHMPQVPKSFSFDRLSGIDIHTALTLLRHSCKQFGLEIWKGFQLIGRRCCLYLHDVELLSCTSLSHAYIH